MTLPKMPWRTFEVMSRLLAPIVSAPMAGVSGPELASSVARAGGLGFLGLGFAKDGEALQRSGKRTRYSYVMSFTFGTT